MKNKKKYYYIKYWLPLVIYCCLIFLQSSLDVPANWLRSFDKLGHFIVYAFLGILIFRAFSSISKTVNVFIIIILSILFSTVIGLADEIFQLFVPSRTIDRIDVLFDFAGSSLGVFSVVLIRFLKKPKHTEKE